MHQGIYAGSGQTGLAVLAVQVKIRRILQTHNVVGRAIINHKYCAAGLHRFKRCVARKAQQSQLHQFAESHAASSRGVALSYSLQRLLHCFKQHLLFSCC